MFRIISIANMLNGSNTHVDIGCDHCYLCKYCIEKNYVNNFINIDINEAPLKSGKNNINIKYLDRVKFIQNDGLKNLVLNFDSLSISGLGAKTIIDILKNNINKYKFGVLQANNNIHLLRKYFKDNNLKIIDEQVVYENNIYYVIIKYNFEPTNIKNKIDLYIGPLFKNKINQTYHNFLLSKMKYYESFINDTSSLEIKDEYLCIKEFLKSYES